MAEFFNVLFSKCTFRKGIDIDTDIDIIIEVNIKSSIVTLTTLKLKNKSFSTNSILYCFYRASFITFFLSRNVSNFLPILLFGTKKFCSFITEFLWQLDVFYALKYCTYLTCCVKLVDFEFFDIVASCNYFLCFYSN